MKKERNYFNRKINEVVKDKEILEFKNQLNKIHEKLYNGKQNN